MDERCFESSGPEHSRVRGVQGIEQIGALVFIGDDVLSVG